MLHLVFSHLLNQRKSLLFLFILFCYQAQAVKVEFPDEELASESVLPMVETPGMILNRNVTLKSRFEINSGVSWGLGEPFYYPIYPMAQLSFHFTEIHSLSVTGLYYFPILSSAGRQLREGKGLQDKTFDASKSPYPQYSLFLNYQYTPFYGKISLAKNFVLNLSIYGFAGGGMVVSNQNDYLPSANLGIGQKFYFNKWLGLRGDLAVYGYYGPAVARLNLGSDSGAVRYQGLSSNQKRINFNITAGLGLIFILL